MFGGASRRAAGRGGRHLRADPPTDHVGDVPLLLLAERGAGGNPVPLLEAAPAAGGGGVLGHEHRVAPVGGLPPVVAGRCRREPGSDDLEGMAPQELRPVPDRPLELRSLQVEPGPERLAGEPEEQPVDLVHAQSLAGHPLPPPGTPGPRATAMLDSAPGEGCKLPGVWSIGEFSECCGLSVKALRSYGGIGLLPPAAIDAVSGYRYYAADQQRSADALVAAALRAGTTDNVTAVVLAL